MREIKFRVFYSDRQQMVYLDQFGIGYGQIGWSIDHYVDLSTGSDAYADKEEGEIMQFTGLQDKNGKDIYEGDIVRWRFPHITHNKGSVHVVRYAVDCMAFTMDLSPWVHDQEMSINYEEEITIIGNIYENPELIK